MTIGQWDAVLIASSATKAYWKSRPPMQTQVEYWISGEVSERFRPQLQGQLYVSQLSWVEMLA
jgi:hypothetical protein